MPLYEYECGACGHRFERIQKFSDPLVTVCPVCGGEVHKLMSSPAVQFKGSGWYVTDYARTDKDTKERKTKDAEGTDKKESTEKTGKKDTSESSPKETKDTKEPTASKESGSSSTSAPEGKTTDKKGS